jgi:outer membrane lipoprotein SlyB
MAEASKKYAVGVFDEEAQAEQAIAALWRAGFSPDRIDVVNRRIGLVKGTPRIEFQKDAADGAATGAVAGAGTGAVVGAMIGSLFPPMGTILGGIGGAALGAAGGTFVGAFIAMEISEDEAHHYSTIVDQGRTLVIVRQIGRTDEAREIFRAHRGRELGECLTPSSTP